MPRLPVAPVLARPSLRSHSWSPSVVRRSRGPERRSPAPRTVCRTRTDSETVAPVVTMSSTTSTSPSSLCGSAQSATLPTTFRCRAALDSPTESRTSAFIRSAGRRSRPDHPTWPRVPSGRRGHRRVFGRQPRVGAGTTVSGAPSTPHANSRPQPTSQRVAERADQVGSAVFLDRHDRVATSPRVPAEREDRHAGVDSRSAIRCGSSARTRSRRAQASAPPGRRRAAAAAFQRKDQVEHAVSVAAGGDIPSGPVDG